jgi:hypothetical protein
LGSCGDLAEIQNSVIRKPTGCLLPAGRNKDCVDYAVDFCASERGQVALLEAFLEPLDFPRFDALGQTVV